MAPTVTLEYTKGKELKKKSRDLTFVIMGKSQKFSKYPSAFVPDYRPAAEIIGESEGFGSSGRVDSEDSCAPKRKCIRLNGNECDVFNVPFQVISLSKMSGSERKEMEMRLRAELEQIKILKKKVHSKKISIVGGVALSSSINGRAKKWEPVGQSGSQLKRGITGRFESVKQAHTVPTTSSSDAMVMKQCGTLIKQLMSHKFAYVFNSPVDAVKLNIPDYHTVIKHPMDLGTIKKKIQLGSYTSPWGFVADVRLTFTNAMTYNPPGNVVHGMADTMSKLFEKKWQIIEKKLAADDLHVNIESEASKLATQPNKRKDSPGSHSVVPQRVKPRLTVEEKVSLGRHLESLQDIPQNIIDFLRQHTANSTQTIDEEIEVDIDSLCDDTLVKLKKLLDGHMVENHTGQQTKSEPSEMEILNESGLSTSSMHPCKGNEPVDEDVDIVGNDPPISSYPPVEIDKDTAIRSSKCSSSSSSSSDSSSASSDADSGSSSGSESDDKVASPAKSAKGGAGPEIALDLEKSDIMSPLDMKRSASRLDLSEQDDHTQQVSIEADGHQEGENAPSERQVSPEKLYRAALLRSRFADTILKAREKTLDQGEKGDPEKLRREREELERQQREEKVRLQAEAKAAEAARRRAEAEAAAEAKRKREIEREAARQALLKMEKTVEINENCLILKDLEMLGTVPGEHVPISVDETGSPGHSQEGMGGFMLGGSNPLERLGLYMKVDDEEEEEAEPGTVPSKDVEEGEID